MSPLELAAQNKPQKSVPSGGLYDNNPYRDQEYYESPWQGFLYNLGFRTQADAWRENMSVQAAEYDAAIAQKLRDEEYNSPLQQAARLRAAGINPDLEGGANVDPGSAAPMPEDPSTPMQSTGEEGSIMNFANGVLGCFTSALGIASSIQGVQRNRLQNNLLSLENESNFSEFARKMFPFFLPESPETKTLEDGSSQSWQYGALERAKLFAGNMPRSMQRKFLSSVQSFWNSAPGSAEAYKSWRDRVTNRKGYYNDSSYFYDESDQVLRVIADGLQSTNEDIYKLRQKADKSAALADDAENKNREDYATELDGKLQGAAENAANDVSKQNNEMVGIMRQSLTKMIHNLDKLSKESGLKGGLATIAMSLLSMFQLYISTQGMPSISRSSSFSNKGGKISESHSTSLSM